MKGQKQIELPLVNKKVGAIKGVSGYDQCQTNEMIIVEKACNTSHCGDGAESDKDSGRERG